MSMEAGKQLVRDLVDAHQRHDAAGVKKALSPDLRWHYLASSSTFGRDDYLQGIEMGRKAFDDLTIRIEDLVAEGDRVVARTSNHMRHVGEFLDMPATNRVIEFSAFWLFRIAGGQIEEIWHLDQDFTPKLR